MDMRYKEYVHACVSTVHIWRNLGMIHHQFNSHHQEAGESLYSKQRSLPTKTIEGELILSTMSKLKQLQSRMGLVGETSTNITTRWSMILCDFDVNRWTKLHGETVWIHQIWLFWGSEFFL